MALLTFKWTAAFIILIISLGAGFASVRFANRQQKLLQFGDALANGVFIGAALFHLFPNAVSGLQHTGFHAAHTYAIGLIILSFIVILALEHFVLKPGSSSSKQVNAWLLMGTLSVHALIAGIALGISNSSAIASIIFFAILAHKCFEVFALVIKVHRSIPNRVKLLFLFIIFSCITPLGIAIGTLSDTFFSPHMDSILTAFFSAFAAGTFLYIGSVHTHHKDYLDNIDSYDRYTLTLTTIAGIAAMALLGIWV